MIIYWNKNKQYSVIIIEEIRVPYYYKIWITITNIADDHNIIIYNINNYLLYNILFLSILWFLNVTHNFLNLSTNIVYLRKIMSNATKKNKNQTLVDQPDKLCNYSHLGHLLTQLKDKTYAGKLTGSEPLLRDLLEHLKIETHGVKIDEKRQSRSRTRNDLDLLN